LTIAYCIHKIPQCLLLKMAGASLHFEDAPAWRSDRDNGEW
jgi:hypothetical protein